MPKSLKKQKQKQIRLTIVFVSFFCYSACLLCESVPVSAFVPVYAYLCLSLGLRLGFRLYWKPKLLLFLLMCLRLHLCPCPQLSLRVRPCLCPVLLSLLDPFPRARKCVGEELGGGAGETQFVGKKTIC